MGVSGTSSAQDLGQDVGTPGFSYLPILQDKYAGSFTHDESVSLDIEGAGDPSRREGGHVGEASDSCIHERCFTPPR